MQLANHNHERGTMLTLAGKCIWSEETRSNGRVFVLCDVQGVSSLLPVSRPGEDQQAPGISITTDMKRLRLEVFRLPDKVQRITFGVWVPENFDIIGSTPLTGQLALESGMRPQYVVKRPSTTGYRYALLGIGIRRGGTWAFGPLRRTEFYRDRKDMGRRHALPEWWMRSRA